MSVKRLIRDEKGQALILALILLVVGGLIITSLLGLMNTGLITGQVYEDKMHMLYAADAGVEDALWKIKNVGLADLFAGYYDEYDYYGQWSYNLSDPVNGKNVIVTIENVWIPKDIPAPDATIARRIIEEGKLIIAGGPLVAVESTYKIEISYAWNCTPDLLLKVNTIGIWLPPGFEYVEGSSDLEKASGEPYYCEPDIAPYKGGYAVVWNFASVALVNFPPTGTASPLVKTFTFQYSGPEGETPGAAVSWIDTSGVPGITFTWDADVKIYKISSTATDPNTGAQTTVDAYTTKIEMRELGSAISGDYVAIGATLMTPDGGPISGPYGPYYRDVLFRESSAPVQSSEPENPGYIPPSAHVDAAWLYWSGWIEGGAEEGGAEEVWSDDGHDFSDWIYGNHWSVQPPYGGGDKEFRGQGGGSDTDRTLTMHISGIQTHSLDLSPYSGREVTISWQQREEQTGSGWPPPGLESGDCLKYAFSGNGGASWSAWNTAFCDDNPSSSFSDTIPPEYVTNNFKMRFRLDFDETNEYCYIDDISISVSPAGAGSSVEDAKVNRVLFGTTGNMTEITAALGDCQVELTPDSGAPDSWCYSCFYDATDIVIAELDPDTKSGTFILGHVLEGTGTQLCNYPSGTTDGTTAYPLATPALSTALQYQWSYAGWSLIIIYSSPETKGHQLYLFDDLRYVAVHTTMEFPISGFLVPDRVRNPDGTWEENAAHMTCFVGDGDEHYPGDFIALNDYKLWDGITVPSIRAPWPLYPPYEYYANPYDNVWNSKSVGLATSGIDIDSFSVTWESDVLEPDDTSATVSLGNASSDEDNAELIMVVYIIISFRSSITSGGIISYLIS